MGFSLDDYIDVAERIKLFYEQHPDGRLTTENWEIVDTEAGKFVFCHARAYRAADDELPGDGFAWEPFPGKTPYTRDSELMNAQTASWGRAIVATGILASKKIASRQEVQARQGGGHAQPVEAATRPENAPERYADFLRRAIQIYDKSELVDERVWASMIASASTKDKNKTLVKGLEAKLTELGGNVELVRERFQAQRQAVTG